MRNTSAFTCVVIVAVALAGEQAAAQNSHLGQAIGDHVVLRDGTVTGRFDTCPATASFNNRGLLRVLPDGTLSSTPFRVPDGRQLVVTDVEWTVDAAATGAALIPGDTVRTRIRIGSGTTFNNVFLSRTVQVGSESGAVSGSEQLTAGFAVASNTAICPGSTSFGQGVIRTARLIEIVVRGYLINAP